MPGRAGGSPQIAHRLTRLALAHNRLQQRTSIPASPRAPGDQPGCPTCRPYILCELTNATQVAPCVISTESCQQLQATDPTAARRAMRNPSTDLMMHARVSQTCRSSCCDMVIDLLHAVACMLHLRWTRRRHDLDQSNPVLRRRGPAATLLFESMEQIELFQTVRNTERPTGPQQRSRDFNCGNAGLSSSSSKADAIEATRTPPNFTP